MQRLPWSGDYYAYSVDFDYSSLAECPALVWVQFRVSDRLDQSYAYRVAVVDDVEVLMHEDNSENGDY